jgi:hypothetical protein
MKTYRGIRNPYATVFIDGSPLNPRLDLPGYSREFEWGYSGSGPAQLALALLADYFQDQPNGDDLAMEYHALFEREVVAALNRWSDWELTSEDIEQTIGRLKELSR